MSHPLHGRSFLKELDFTPEEWRSLLELAAELKAAKKNGTEKQYLKGKNIALILKRLPLVLVVLLRWRLLIRVRM